MTNEADRARADSQLSGSARALRLHVGQRVVITVNRRRRHRDFANGTVGMVTQVICDRGTGRVGAVHVQPEEWAPNDTQPPLEVKLHYFQCNVSGRGLQRRQLPLIPAHAITIHRVQGMTLEGDVHLLLNSEVFADGQAYVAISRVRRLDQLHFWALDLSRFKAARGVGAAAARVALGWRYSAR